MIYKKIKNELLKLDTMSCTKNCLRYKIIKEENIEYRPQNFSMLNFYVKFL